MGKSFDDLTSDELQMISHALAEYQLHGLGKRKSDYNDKENVLQRRINTELKYRKENLNCDKEHVNVRCNTCQHKGKGVCVDGKIF